MWILPLLVLGAIAIAASSRSAREAAPPSRQLMPPLPPPLPSGPPFRTAASAAVPAISSGASSAFPPGVPGPIAVLGEIIRIGKRPPPMVIMCAVAEAEAIGRPDLASDIVQVFVAPVVYAHALKHRPPAPMPYARGTCAPSCAPQAQPARGTYGAQRVACLPSCAPVQRGACAPVASPQAQAACIPILAPAAAMLSSAAPRASQRYATQDEILGMIHTDPSAFLKAVSRPPMIDVPVAAPASPPPPQAAPAPAPAPHASVSVGAEVYTPAGPIPVPPGAATQLWPPEANYPGMDVEFALRERLRRGEVPPVAIPALAAVAQPAPQPAPQHAPSTVSEATLTDDVSAQLLQVPGFAGAGVVLVDPSTGMEVFEVSWLRGYPIPPLPQQVSHWPVRVVIIDDLPVIQETVQPTGMHPETVAQMQEAAGEPEAADRTRSLAAGSPLSCVSDEAWRQFVMRLERESPQFESSRHVGQYRQRRERLADLGIDPRSIHGNAPAQRAALDRDLVDAHRHAADGGILSEHLNRTIAVPGLDGMSIITLSGLLGVIQCAGLDGAVGWLERPNDRKRYPHTTLAFLHTNGVF
jgi:hypothetical protein